MNFKETVGELDLLFFSLALLLGLARFLNFNQKWEKSPKEEVGRTKNEEKRCYGFSLLIYFKANFPFSNPCFLPILWSRADFMISFWYENLEKKEKLLIFRDLFSGLVHYRCFLMSCNFLLQSEMTSFPFSTPAKGTHSNFLSIIKPLHNILCW